MYISSIYAIQISGMHKHIIYELQHAYMIIQNLHAHFHDTIQAHLAYFDYMVSYFYEFKVGRP